MPTFRSHKCCTHGGDIPFGTVSYIDKSCEIHVLLRKKPCCDKEFEILLTILRQVRQMIGDRSFIILYTLRSCTFDRRYMSPQEDILHGAKKCALICNSSFFRFVIDILKHKNHTTLVKTFQDSRNAIHWLRSTP